MKIVPQQTFLQEIDDWVQGKAKPGLPERVVFVGIIIRKIIRCFDNLQAIAIGTLQVLKLITQVQETFSGKMNMVVGNVSANFAGNTCVHGS